MGERMSRLPDWATSVMIDTCCFIYHFQADEYPVEAAYVEELLRLVERGRLSALTSPVTVAEIMAKPRRHGLDEVAYAYKLLLLNFPNLRIPPIDVAVADKASMLRGRFGLKLPDALQVATGIIHGASAFITFDREIRRVAQVIPVIIPGE
ncbi:MAG: type II toxin-antitoxin system VapC family toxin [Firmicutes bacterium]|nr:type II toxin-antitoxin system VapC family toxin [Bacillota bacterium]